MLARIVLGMSVSLAAFDASLGWLEGTGFLAAAKEDHQLPLTE